MLCPCADVPRLNAPPARPVTARPALSRQVRTCLDCGEPFASPSPDAEFCGSACRQAFNTRRSKRGAELYDLLMALRHDRKAATLLKVWTLLSRCAAIYREEDRAERAGRRSWRDPAEILKRRPYLRAEVLLQSQGSPRTRHPAADRRL